MATIRLPVKKVGKSSQGLLEARLCHRPAGDENNFPTGCDRRKVRLQCSSQQSLGPVSLDSIPYRPPGGDSKPGLLPFTRKSNQHNKRVGMRLP